MTTPVLVATALVAGIVATWLARHLAWRVGVVAPPRPMVPAHVRPVACLGGLGIGAAIAVTATVGTLAGVRVLPVADDAAVAIALGLILYLSLGTVDDVVPLAPAPKLLLQTSAAWLIAIVARPDTSAGELAVSVLWIVAVVNAVNLVDVCDGLAGSLAAVALAAVAAVSPSAAPLALVTAAATIGFLAFNRAPASIFLGDGGSHLLGFAIGGLWLLAIHEAPSWNRAASAVLGVGVFGFEVMFLIVVRTRRRLPFWRASPDHVAMRLQAAGLSRGQTVAVALVPATALAALSQWLAHAPGRLATAAASMSLLALVITGLALARFTPPPFHGSRR